ncbi:hemerythrin HHE cation binding domain protein [Hydrogenophaga sp. RAC07]|uniref:hemerythrin domain-containing protein n=1 Tax=Hydrogenophaga sp. RAC07 TaxID=1842537 RepID=UPI00083E22EA|nr:hemerythrin domain-containing protein [Hydrogenophaga sp. RAC07]AOF86053.1 hemerythrin HHE cation binding domain protein [Hydrogenophaga sp. RAC07]
MQSHAIEIAHVTAAARTGLGRFNLYAGIHKALRALMTDTLLTVGRADPGDAADVNHAVTRVVELMNLCTSHVNHENNFVHPALEARCPGVCGPIAQEHDGHLHHIAHLRDAAVSLLKTEAGEREPALQALYLALALFVADNFQHMHAEETVHNSALWAAYSDAELVGIHDALLATIEPAEMMLVMRWMLPQLNAPERLEVMQGMRAGAPAPVFEGMLTGTQGLLNQRDWAKLARGLGLPPVPGLVTA